MSPKLNKHDHIIAVWCDKVFRNPFCVEERQEKATFQIADTSN